MLKFGLIIIHSSIFPFLSFSPLIFGLFGTINLGAFSAYLQFIGIGIFLVYVILKFANQTHFDFGLFLVRNGSS